MLSLTLSLLLTSWTCADEDARIRAHLEDAWVQLSHAAPPGLSAQQQAGRAAALGRLRAYIDAGRFPRNHSARPATPVFVDDRGTHCAMGQLLADLGAERVVERIHAQRNLETVPVLADEPGLAPWLEAHGMTAEEAALVQPTYFFCAIEVPCFRRPGAPVYDGKLVRDPASRDVTFTPVRRLTDAGVCIDDIVEDASFWELVPSGALVASPQFLYADPLGWFRLNDLACAERPRMTDADRLIEDPRECIRALARRDLQWFAVQCSDLSWPAEQRLSCSPDGRFRSSHLPPKGTMRAELTSWLASHGLDLADAGIDPTAYGAMERRLWDLSDDGGAQLHTTAQSLLVWNGGPVSADVACVNDAGSSAGPTVSSDAGAAPPAPASHGCSTGSGLGVVLAILLGRRRTRPSARES